MYLRRHNTTAALKILQMTESLEAEDGKHFTMWSTLESDCGNLKEARRIIELGGEVTPSHQLYKIVMIFDILASRFPGDPFLLQRWGTLESQLGNFTAARDLFMKSVEIKPHAPTFVAWAMLEEVQELKVAFLLLQISIVILRTFI